MKKTILTASLLVTIHFFVNAQNFTTVNTENNMVCHGTKTFKPGIQLNTAINGLQKFYEEEPISDYERYMKKSSDKNTAAWLLLGGGAICTVIGVLSYPKNNNILGWGLSESEQNKVNSASTVALIGIAVMLTSIPLFVSSHYYKRKARLIISNQKTGFGIPHKYGKELTGVTLSIPMGR